MRKRKNRRAREKGEKSAGMVHVERDRPESSSHLTKGWETLRDEHSASDAKEQGVHCPHLVPIFIGDTMASERGDRGPYPSFPSTPAEGE